MCLERERSRILAVLLLLAAIPAASVRAQQPPAPTDPLEELSLEELLRLPVVSASNRTEPLSEAPATVVVLTRDDLRQRGYSELSQILDDLPGMDPVRPFGATYFKNYWRGWRNTIGDPFLILVDGVVFNHLYFNTADVLATFPLSNVERVEVVYGPASSIYGANATNGVINVITRRPGAEGGTESIRLESGNDGRRIADAWGAWRQGELELSVAGRFDDGEVDAEAARTYEYFKDGYYSDRRLWGGFVDNESIAGQFASGHRNRAIDLRARWRSLEVGFQSFVLDSGYGMEYPGDRAQADAVWKRPDESAWLRRRAKLGDDLTSSTTIRWRSSGVAGDSFFVEARDVVLDDGTPQRQARYSYWGSENTSWTLEQDFEFVPSESWNVTAGFRGERKDLQKAYQVAAGPFLPVDEIDASTYPYPQPVSSTPARWNRIRTEDTGLYVQTTWRLDPSNRLHAGFRSDRNSEYGRATTIRAGWVWEKGAWGAKALYGQAYQEPTPRLLYGGWTGSGSDPELRPERSRTVELQASHGDSDLAALVSAWYVASNDTIVNTTDGAQNLGERKVAGYDLHLQGRLPFGGTRPAKVWGYFSRIVRAEQSGAGTIGQAPTTGEGESSVGDLARSRAWLGLTVFGGDHLVGTIRTRYAGPRTTVATNPVRHIGGAGIVDLSLAWEKVFDYAFSVELRGQNVLDHRSAQPGVREADAGSSPGGFDADGAWNGSTGWYSSVLPQAGRSLALVLRFEP